VEKPDRIPGQWALSVAGEGGGAVAVHGAARGGRPGALGGPGPHFGAGGRPPDPRGAPSAGRLG